jgi:hypothetical protein
LSTPPTPLTESSAYRTEELTARERDAAREPPTPGRLSAKVLAPPTAFDDGVRGVDAGGRRSTRRAQRDTPPFTFSMAYSSRKAPIRWLRVREEIHSQSMAPMVKELCGHEGPGEEDWPRVALASRADSLLPSPKRGGRPGRSDSQRLCRALHRE